MKINKKYSIGVAFIIVFALVILLFLFGSFLEHKRPNVILITFDALRSDHLGCYGYLKDTSPFLDSFSRKSFVFTNVIAQSASTVPALAAIFASHFPYLDGVVTKEYTLGDKYLTLTTFLKSKGYDTFAVLGHTYVKSKFGFNQGFDFFDDDFKSWRNSEEVFNQVKQLFQNKTIKNNFFLWVHIREPHAPYNPPEEYVSKFFLPKVEGSEPEKHESYIIYGGNKLLTKQEIQRLVSKYDGNIRYADEYLRKMFDYFEEKGLYNNTLFIITSDHGESLGEHNIFDHNNLYYGILRVPLIVKIPGYKGKSISDPVSSIDIFPTILDVLGYHNRIHQLKLRGKSLLEKRKPGYVQFSEYPGIYSVIEGGWRLNMDITRNHRSLFHVKDDPLESTNYIENNKDIYKLLQKALQALLDSTMQQTSVIDKKALLDDEEKVIYSH